MAYTPTEWETGDVITAEKLNKAEEGIADATALIIPIVFDDTLGASVLMASYNDLIAAKDKLIVAQEDYIDPDGEIDRYYLSQVLIDSGSYKAIFIGFDGTDVARIKYAADSADANMQPET